MRKRSAATQLRYEKCTVNNLKMALRIVTEELKQRRHFGHQMSNICFNLAQTKTIDDSAFISMDICRKDWDAIKSTHDLDQMLKDYGATK